RLSRWSATVLLSRAPARWAGARAPLSATPHRPRPERRDQSWQGLRSRATTRPGGGGLSCDGRAMRHQGAAAPVADFVESDMHKRIAGYAIAIVALSMVASCARGEGRMSMP